MVSSLRANFDRELVALREAVLLLGSLARRAVAMGLRAYLEHDCDAAAEVIGGDREINERRTGLEQRCYSLLAREQPVAGDMRAIVAALQFAGELERIADHGKKMARICQRTAAEPHSASHAGLAGLGDIAVAMLDDALAAVASLDPAAARLVSARDDEADASYRQVFNETLSHMVANPRAINDGTQLIQVAHELERVADRATNIAERVIYIVSGELVDLNA